MSNPTNYTRFADLSFEDFKKMAKDSSLSCYEKIGFPDSYRHNKEAIIFEDILSKLSTLSQKNKVVLEIGPGCSTLPQMLLKLCQSQNHQLIWVDCEEMLELLPQSTLVTKIPGFYPNCEILFDNFLNKIDVILVYSVLHYIFVESNLWDFLDRSLELLADGGEMLIGDIPNISKRKRFFKSTNGIKFHQKFTDTQEIPNIFFNQIERHKIDDSVMISIISRARSQGFDAYILPQREDLPMANRREDIFIKKP